MEEIKYDCWSNNEEDFDDDLCTILDIHFGDIDTYEEALESSIYAGVSIKPNIKAIDLANTICKDIADELYQLCGEHADSYTTSTQDFNDLRDYLDFWLAKQNFNCYSVKKVKYTPVIDYLTIEEIKEYYE